MQHACTAGLFALVLVQFTSSIIGEPLGLYVKHHEPLSYSTAPVHAAHQRCRRSTAAAADRQVAVEFHALGRHFRLRLRRDVATSVFSTDAVLVAPSGVYEPLGADHMYEGHLEGVPHSFVHGSLHDGVFQGNIETPEGNYYIEKSQYYYPVHNRSRYHSVIYSDEHLHTPQHVHTNGKGPFGGCGVDDETEAWMSVIQKSADESETSAARDKLSAPVYPAVHQHRAQTESGLGDKHYKYTEEAQRQLFDVPRRRHRRSPRLGGATSHLRDGRGTCSISVETDPLLWAQIYEHERDARRTREELTALVASHIKAVNRIYEREQFDGVYPHRGIQFEIQRLKIDNDTSCDPLYPGKRNKFCIRHIDVSNFLNLHSEDDHDAFCLSYVFTYRDFDRGTLGLAWVASAEGSSGGICESYKSYSTTVHKVPITKKRSLNTGIITLVNYSKRVASRVSQLTLAHEIGHNMGSPHDYPSSCTPGSPSGNFIMYSSATSGDLPNNSKFSECSRRNISAVLDAITVAGSKRDCFTKSDGAFCGNKIVEDGEECDCGFDMSECEERCCYPSQVSLQDRSQNASAVGCTRRINTQCSPSEGPCCDRSQCRFVGAFENRQCREADECTYSSQCDGRVATCPPSPPRNNMTECNKGTKVCLDGVCKGSICLKHDLQECFLTSDAIEDSGKLCEVACQQGADPSTCRSSSELGMRRGDGIYMTAGAACDNFQGYCDVFLKCRRVDAEGPLASLKNLLFSKQTLMTIVEWVTVYWWGVLLMSIMFVIVMALFIRCFAVHTPSSNPKRAPARRFADTLKHPMGTLRRQRRPPSGSRPVPSSSSAASRQPSATELQLVTPQGPPPPYSSHQQHRTPQQLQQLPATPAASAGSTAAAAAPTRHGYGQGRGHYSRQAASRSEAALASAANSDRKTPSKQPRGKRGGAADPPTQPSRGRRA